MKKIVFYLWLILPCFLSAQRVKKIHDPALVAQEKRQVFERWGNWLPEAKYIKIFGTPIGENISHNHAMVWGKWLPPKQNRQYMLGEDIRPLKATGLETQRYVKAKLMEEEAKNIKKSIDTIYKRSVADMSHYTHLTAPADPLYLLYYKKMLAPLQKFPEKANTPQEWGITNPNTFQQLKETGQYDMLVEKISLAKETYQKALKLDMPRGKRFLMYHKALISWREFQSMLKRCVNSNDLYAEYSQKLKKIYSGFNQTQMQSDKEIIQGVMQRYKYKF